MGKPRISLRDLEKDISEGGLKLTNILNFNYALKLSWIKRITDKPGAWQANFESSLGINRSQVWELDIASLKHCSNNLSNQFWKEVLLAWHTYKSCFIDNIDVRTYPIWNTVFMVNQNLISLKPELEDKGVKYINDLLDQSGNIMGYLSFVRKVKFNLNFVDFYSLTHAIPRSWLINLRETKIKLGVNQVNQKVLADILSMDKVCKGTYWTFVNLYKSKRKTLEKWNLCLNENIDIKSLSIFYRIPFTSTIESKLRSFQYKILQQILPTNKILKLCNIRDSEYCSYCEIEVETIEHLFWKCRYVKIFWNQIAESLLPYIDLSLVINEKCILLGVTQGENLHLVNHILITCKRYIYINKFVSNKLTISAAHNMLRDVYEIEKNIVMRKALNDKKLNCKWELLKVLFDGDTYE